MITAQDLERIPLFAGVETAERARLAELAADVHLAPGQWLIREGEDPRFFVVLKGELEATKEIFGQCRVLGRVSEGAISGELSVFMRMGNTITLRALTPCRVARFDAQQLQEIVLGSSEAAQVIFQAMSERTSLAQKIIQETPSARVRVSGSRFDAACREIRSFLAANRVHFDWTPSEQDDSAEAQVTVTVDGAEVAQPTLRRVAETLHFQTTPKHDVYDVVIVGAGPAGMAAGVYSASEGLRALVVERFCAGGQAGTSSRIENYLGFPTGISGDDLTERALKQAHRFGVELLVTRTVQSIDTAESQHCVVLDGSERVRARVVLLSTGVSWNRLNFSNHDRFLGRGILYGASRFEGATVAGYRVFIVGGGNSAGQAAVYHANYAAEVILLVRGPGLKQSMSQYLIRQLEETTNVRVEPYTQVIHAEGEGHLERITTATRHPDGTESLLTREAKALFIMTGATAKTEWLPETIQRDAQGYVRTGRDVSHWSLDRQPFALETSVPGIFCAGDVRHGSIKRVASSVGEGSVSVSFIHEYLALPTI